MVAAEHTPHAATRLVLLGAPGSGKGTQAARLAERLEVPAISTGEMLRAAVQAGSELGNRVRDIMSTGELVDDETMAGVVRGRLSQPDAASGFLLDGYPRTLRQASDLERLLEDLERALDAVVLIAVQEAELVRRALKRGRADDREEIVRERLRVYREKTEPLIEHYRELGLLREVDGEQSREAVLEAILAVLGGSS